MFFLYSKRNYVWNCPLDNRCQFSCSSNLSHLTGTHNTVRNSFGKTFFTKFSNYGTLVIAIPAAYAVYRLRYESVGSWEGLGGDFLALMIAVGGAFMAASTTTTAVTSLGSKTE